MIPAPFDAPPAPHPIVAVATAAASDAVVTAASAAAVAPRLLLLSIVRGKHGKGGMTQWILLLFYISSHVTLWRQRGETSNGKKGHPAPLIYIDMRLNYAPLAVLFGWPL